MADPKTKAANGNYAVGKTPSEPKTKVNGNSAASTPIASPATLAVSSPVDKTSKQSKLWQMLALAQDVVKDSQAISEYETSIEGRQALEKDLAHKEGEVQKLRDFNKNLIRELSEFKAQSAGQAETLVAAFEQRYKAYDTNKTAVEAMQAEVTEVKVKLEAAKVDAKNKQAEVEKLIARVKDADQDAKAHGVEMKELIAESELQRSKLETGAAELTACKSKLATARADLGDDILRDYDAEGLRNVGLELKALSKKCHNLALEYFNDPEGAKDSVTEIAELKTRFPQIPLTTATTKAAAKLRCAAAEAVIANILITQIFAPFHLSPDARAAATALLDIFGKDERRRAVYRCQVLQSHQGEEAARVEEDIVRRASNEVRTALHALVSVEKQAGFYSSNAVPGFFRDALKLWAEVQRARDPIHAVQAEYSEGCPPGKYSEYDQTPVMSPRSPKGMPAAAAAAAAAAATGNGNSIPKGATIAAVLFPQVETREDIIFSGMVLWTSQAEAPPAPAPTASSYSSASASAAAVPAAAPSASMPPIVKSASVNLKSTPPIVGAGDGASGGGSGGGGGRRHQRRRSVIAEDGTFKGKQNGHGGGGNGGASVAMNGGN